MRAALRSANAGSIDVMENFSSVVCVAFSRPSSLFVVVNQTEPSGATAASGGASRALGAAREITVGDHDELLLAARKALADPPTAEHLRRTRPRIERLLGLLAHRYGARKSRYTGSAKARLQAAWAAALVNLNPIGHRL